MNRYDPQPPNRRPLRIVDLCAGIGGFHRAVVKALVSAAGRTQWAGEPECVLACDVDPELRSIYVRNFPELELTYRRFHPPLDVVAAGLDLWDENGRLVQIHGDLHELVDVSEGSHALRLWPAGTSLAGTPMVPDHDLLCAGFPCQPFSKSGTQLGFSDYRGTVFGSIAVILEAKRPPYVILENVGNFERHDCGRTWRIVHEKLKDLDYQVIATTHRLKGQRGHGLVSPHHVGFPQHRERFFAVAQLRSVGLLSEDRSPLLLDARLAMKGETRQRFIGLKSREAAAKLEKVLSGSMHPVSPTVLRGAQLTTHRVDCINLWNELLAEVDALGPFGANPLRPLPTFPIWGFELDPWNQYPYEDGPPRRIESGALLTWLRDRLLSEARMPGPETVAPSLSPERSFMGKPIEQWGIDDVHRWKDRWPQYAWRSEWPSWKIGFIAQNRDFADKLWSYLDSAWLRGWLERLYHLPPSLQKLEWNCEGDELDLWRHILQFRPSGIRAKRFQHVPSLVAMTTTQIPIVPRPDGEDFAGGHPTSRGRFLLPSEGLQLQGFPPTWTLPDGRGAAFTALGNAVHVGVVARILQRWLLEDGPEQLPDLTPAAVAAGQVPVPQSLPLWSNSVSG